MKRSYYSTTPYGKLRTKKAQEEKQKREERKKQAYYSWLVS